jgi:hypothetical protein
MTVSANGSLCAVSMTEPRTVAATFAPRSGELVVELAPPSALPLPRNQSRPGGSVIGPGISCGALTVDDCAEPVANGQTVTLRAIPNAGFRLAGWTNCDVVNGADCTVTMAGARTVAASFDWLPWPSADVLTSSPQLREAADDVFKLVAAARAWAHDKNTPDLLPLTWDSGVVLHLEGYAAPSFWCGVYGFSARNCSAWGGTMMVDGLGGSINVTVQSATATDASTFRSLAQAWFAPLGLISTGPLEGVPSWSVLTFAAY